MDVRGRGTVQRQLSKQSGPIRLILLNQASYGRCGHILTLSRYGIVPTAHVGGNPGRSANSVCYWILYLLTGFSPSALRAPLDGNDGDEMDELPNEFNEAYQGGAA